MPSLVVSSVVACDRSESVSRSSPTSAADPESVGRGRPGRDGGRQHHWDPTAFIDVLQSARAGASRCQRPPSRSAARHHCEQIGVRQRARRRTRPPSAAAPASYGSPPCQWCPGTAGCSRTGATSARCAGREPTRSPGQTTSASPAAARQQPQPRHRDQPLDRRRQRAVAVGQLRREPATSLRRGPPRPAGGRPPAAAARPACSRAADARRPAGRSGPRRAPPSRLAAALRPRASPTSRTYRSKPTPAMCPDCSPPSRLPAPRISRSFIATAMPAPSSVCCGDGGQPVVGGLGERLLAAGRGSRRSRARRPRPTRPRSWCSCDRPKVSARSTISVLALGMSSPVSTIVVHTRTSNSLLPEVHDDLLERVLGHLAVRDARPAPRAPARAPARRPGSMISTRLWM